MDAKAPGRGRGRGRGRGARGRGGGGRAAGHSGNRDGQEKSKRGKQQKPAEKKQIICCSNCRKDGKANGLQLYDSESYRDESDSGPLFLKVCPLCRKAAYCSQSCEEAHAKQHKTICPKRTANKAKKKKKHKKAAKPDEENVTNEDVEWTSVGQATNKSGTGAGDKADKSLGTNNENAASKEAFGILDEEDESEEEEVDAEEEKGSYDERSAIALPVERAQPRSEAKPAAPSVSSRSNTRTKRPSDITAKIRVETQAKEGSRTTKSTSTAGASVRAKTNNYNKLGRALAAPKKPKAKANKPRALSKPWASGRTSLGESRPTNQELANLMTQDIVLHFDPRRIPVDPRMFYDLMGIYEPMEQQSNGFPFYLRNQGKSDRLIDRFEGCSTSAQRRLIDDRGIYLTDYQDFIPMCLYRATLNNGVVAWRIVTQSGLTRETIDPFSLDLLSISDLRPREREFWVEPDSLFFRASDVFTSWLSPFEQIPIPIAMTPVKMFNRAIELAEMPRSTIPKSLKASDFSFWNKPLVLHANLQKQPGLIQSANKWMGVYLPGGRTYDGYPVWRRSLARTNTLARTVSNKNVKKRLDSLGITLHPIDDDVSACLYMYRHQLHVATADSFESNPTDDFTLRSASVSPQEERLLTQSDALFQCGAKAFAKWVFLLDSAWTEVSVAITPEGVFESAIDLADVEEHFLAADNSDHGLEKESEEARDSANAPKKARKKKKKKKKKNTTTTPAAGQQSCPELPVRPENNEVNRDVEADPTAPEADNQSVPITQSVSDNETRKAYQRSPNAPEGVEELPDTKTAEEDKASSAQQQSQRLARALGLEESSSAEGAEKTAVDETLQAFFDPNREKPLFLLVDESLASSIYESSLQANSPIVSDSTKEWLRSCADGLLTSCIENNWKMFVVSVLQTGVAIAAKTLAIVFQKLPLKCNDDCNNRIARAVTAVSLTSKDEKSQLISAFNKRVGRGTKKHLLAIVSDSEIKMQKAKQASRKERRSSNLKNQNSNPARTALASGEKDKATEQKSIVEGVPVVKSDAMVIDDMKKRVSTAIEWYRELLEAHRGGTIVEDEDFSDGEIEDDDALQNVGAEGFDAAVDAHDPPEQRLSSKEVAAAISRCIKLTEEEQVAVISRVEKSMDLSDWEDDSEWTVEMTEQAHKWFRKHLKRQHHLCDRIIRRLKILSTGRWPYVLCKPVRTSKSIKLYESKIDTGCRLLWEVAVSFSPRRSKANFSCCEQVIRLWDIVLDHDNLTRSIDLAVDRIEKSHLRGQECMIYSELEDFDGNINFNSSIDTTGQRLPRVFAMRQGLESTKDKALIKKPRLYPPASNDPQQFTLVKFYELDAGAISLLLDGETENPDLPFTPGPKEHEIIHFSSEPKRSILLMGRSGTGKTTCLVFRMWAQFMAYEAQGERPRQLFVTKNNVLRNEVEKSFLNMGLAWRRKNASPDIEFANGHLDVSTVNEDEKMSGGEREGAFKFPLFLTSSEWLDILDRELPGERFFTDGEMEARIGSHGGDDDAVQRGVEALFAEEEKTTEQSQQEIGRREMTFQLFRKKWRKVNSKAKSSLDPALVWREIKSYIKGSVGSLHMDNKERSQPKNRFLSLEEYLALPRKVSRLDETLRRTVYELYEVYERIKKEGNNFDEMDLVYNLAGRVSLFLAGMDAQHQGLLPIDSLYVDEVQDFCQNELFLLTKLSRDPNNLMLAGDTAQSITVGVGFRFTDVRQLFYKEFESVEPSLLQLTHNYRSHAGVLRLAACVVELLYFFFSDSLDRLPPDLGLLNGPSPVIMETQSAEELVLMLEGSKRETSRIEFGAHQVVIVRSEEAKQSLPDEFGVDKDWVMTVQETKGLEYDDVLLYNFFTDSEAGEMWRVVSNYTEKDIAAYYEDITVKSSGVSTYEWNSLLETKIRHLDFSLEQHKILETELKMLYTAITRARVNVFIAESDPQACRPMFEYFTRRGVVKVGQTAGDRPIFGKMSTQEDWRKRGEYYILKAEGEGRKGRFRLAAKCFEKAGEAKRRDHALALLAFAEIEDQDTLVMKRRDKHASLKRERLYTIAAQLLEAKDIVFLNKAAYCLVQVGDEERLRGAEMFELYALICYARRQRKTQAKKRGASKQEQEYFSYAAKFFEKGATSSNLSASRRRSLLIQAFRNYMRSGRKEDQELASMLLQSNSHLLRKSFKELAAFKASQLDPISWFDWNQNRSELCQSIKTSMANLARISCRSSYSEDDPVGMHAALDAIPKSERIHMLTSLGADPKQFISATNWSSHSVYQKQAGEGRSAIPASQKINVTSLLVNAYTSNGQHEKAAEILEERGLLLEASECLQSLIQESSDEATKTKMTCKMIQLKAQYLELALKCTQWAKHRPQLEEIQREVKHSMDSPNLPLQDAIGMSCTLTNFRISGGSPWHVLERCEKSPLWRYDAIMMIASSSIGLKGLLSERPNSDFWQNAGLIIQAAEDLGKAASSSLKSRTTRKAEDTSLVAQTESYFDLRQYRFNPHQLSTFSVTNLKLRQAFQHDKKQLENPLLTSSLVLQLDRDMVHAVLGRFLYTQASTLLMLLERHFSEQTQKLLPCLFTKSGMKCREGDKCKHSHAPLLQASRKHAMVLQCRVLCLEQMRRLRREAGERCPDWSAGQSLYKWCRENCSVVAKELAKYLLDGNCMQYKVVDDEYFEKKQDGDNLVWRRSTLQALSLHAHNRWYHLPSFKKEIVVEEALRYWRLLRMCEENKDVSSRIERELQKMEKKKTKNEEDSGSAKKSVDHCISTTDLRFVSRMWIWAVDSVKDDLFNAITLAEELITRTTNLQGLWNLHKSDQISLLEANAIGIFSTLSLRYSANHGCWWLIPKKGYLSCYLSGAGCSKSRGFGLPIQDVLAANIDKHFFECFQLCVVHLEWIAATIVKNELLRPPKADKIEEIIRLERAICLSLFVCANAVLFSLEGKDMTPEEARNELNKLPSIPLSGSINTLVKVLRATVDGCKASPRLQGAFPPLREASKFLDLLTGTNLLLQKSGWEDKFVICRLRQDERDKVGLETLDSIDPICSLLRNVPFHEDRGIFLPRFKPSCQKFLSHSMHEVEAIAITDVSEMSRKSDERKAATTILQYLRSWQRRGKSEQAKVNPTDYFRAWKRVMSRFVGLAKQRMKQVLLVKAEAPTLTAHAIDRSSCPLNALPDLINDQQHCRSTLKKWSHMVESHAPIYDGIECTFCGQFPFPNERAERQYWCSVNCPSLTYRDASIHYNRSRYGAPEAPFDYQYGQISFQQHSYDGIHHHNLKLYQVHQQALTQAAADLDNSFLAVQGVIGVCDSQQGHPYAASWFLNIGEQARTLLRDLETSRIRFFQEAVHWPPDPNIQVLLATLNASSRRAQDFFANKREEELGKARAQEALEEEEEDGANKNDEVVVEKIAGLL